MVDILKETWGTVDELRKFVLGLVQKEAARSDPPKSIPPEHAETWRRLRTFDIRYFAVSDSVFIWVPLDGPGQAGAVYHTLVALAGTELAFLSQGYPLRGGVAVGVASDSVPPSIYGPALSDAIRLESKVAKYPRIVVGSEVVQYLSNTLALEGDTIDEQVQRDMARMCRSLLIQDADGQTVLDYLGPVLRDTFDQTKGESVSEMGQRVRALFVRELTKWSNAGCEKLSIRYKEGLKYVETHLHELSQAPMSGDTTSES
jgi:hypothetical protein